jgi:HSP20 family protein
LAIGEVRKSVRRSLAWQVTAGVWSPPTDLLENEVEYVVTVEVAGMREADFDVIYNKGVLVVSGQRRDVPERRAYHQMEIHFGEFSTAVRLPGPVDLDHSKAEYGNGFLVVRLPKAKRADVKVEE